MRVSYIISYRHTPERILNLRRVLDWLRGFNNIDVIVVEQDTHSKISHLSLNAKHIFIKSDNAVYNKSWAFNVALKRQNNHVVVFADSDIVMDPNELIASISELNNYDVVSPSKSVINLSPADINYPIDALKTLNRATQDTNICGGIVIFKPDAIFKIGGWSEAFEIIGNSVKFQDFKLKLMGINYTELDYRCYHYAHQKLDFSENQKNRDASVLEQLTGLDVNKLQFHISSTVGKIGALNKY